MKRPVTVRDSTPYYEKHFLLCEESPHAYVSAFREAQYESRRKRRNGAVLFWFLVVVAITAWLTGYLHWVLMVAVIGVSWALVSWYNQHEMKLLERTFMLAIKNKNRRFKEYMWRHLDRHLLGSD